MFNVQEVKKDAQRKQPSLQQKQKRRDKIIYYTKKGYVLHISFFCVIECTQPHCLS